MKNNSERRHVSMCRVIPIFKNIIGIVYNFFLNYKYLSYFLINITTVEANYCQKIEYNIIIS